MGSYHHFYMNNPTAGGTDGTQISEDRAFTAPLSVILDATKNESKAVKLALRCVDGYETVGDSVIAPYYWDGSAYQPTGGNISKWQLAHDLSTAGSNTYTLTTNAVSGDTIVVGGVTLTAGTDFAVGADISTTATNIAAAIVSKSALYTATVSGAAITVTEKSAGGGNTPGAATVTGTIAVTSGTAVKSKLADADYMLAKGSWASSLTISDVIGAKNKIIWVKVSASSNESPVKDDTTVLHSTVTVQAAS
jgi:hypothetical protein